MPDRSRKLWKLVSVDVDEETYQKVRAKYVPADGTPPVFPPGVMDNVDYRFLLRCKPSTQIDGCIAFCHKNGKEPDIDSYSGIGSQPTFLGMQPKRVAYIGKIGTDPGPGAVIRATCGHRLCVNQAHLEQTGFTLNQFMERPFTK